MSLTPEGFERPRLPEIKADYDARFTDALGPINTNADAVIGQMIAIFAEALANANEVLQDVYDSMYPYSAEGTSLDGAVAFVGLERLPATATVVTAAAYGSEGTLIPAGSLARSDIQYSSTSDVIISRANALDVEIEVITVTNSAAYQILAGGESVTYTSDASATAEEILSGLAALFSDDYIATVSGEKLRLYRADGETPFAITVDTKLRIAKRGSPVVFVASETGAIACPVGALNIIDTPTLGWDSVYNLKAGATGRDLESDTELRLRHASSVRATGSATVESIKARMLAEVPEVTSIQIYENRTAIASEDGIPPHAFESVIVGGTDSEIADQLWLTKPAGIETHGNVTVTVTDSEGDLQVVKFSRPVPKYAWIKVDVTDLDDEESLPISANAAIKQAVFDYATANIGVGDDIIIQRFYGPIYASVPGLAQMTITADLTDSSSDTPSYGSSNIPVLKAENAVFSLDRITVTGV